MQRIDGFKTKRKEDGTWVSLVMVQAIQMEDLLQNMICSQFNMEWS